MKKRIRKALFLVNTFGAVGYFLMALAWTFFASAVLLLLMQSSVISGPTDVGLQDGAAQATGGGTMFIYIIAYGVTIIMGVLTLAIVLLLPYLIGKWGARAMRRLLGLCRIALSRQNLFLAKGLMNMVPLIGFIVLNLLYEPIDMTIPSVHVATIFLSLLSLGMFVAQLLAARSLAIAVKDMW